MAHVLLVYETDIMRWKFGFAAEGQLRKWAFVVKSLSDWSSCEGGRSVGCVD